MNTLTSSLNNPSWKDLYRVALHEPDRNKLPERIANAEIALVLRARELFYTSEDRIEEQESLDDALCILRALRNSLKHGPSSVQGANPEYLRSA
jgi:hypothetical protein